MNENTRYALLLFAVLTFITSSFIAINALSNESGETTQDQGQELNESNQAVNETGQTVNETDNTAVNSTDSSTGDGQSSEENESDGEPEGLIGKAVGGFELLFSDIGEGIEILAN